MPTASCETLHVISFETATTCRTIKQATHNVGTGRVTMTEAEEDLIANLRNENKATVAFYVFAATTIWSNIIVSKNKGTKPNIFFHIFISLNNVLQKYKNNIEPDCALSNGIFKEMHFNGSC